MLFFTLFELFLYFSCFDLQNNVFLCEIVLYSVENYGFYFNGLRSRGAHFAFLMAVCVVDLKMKRFVTSLDQASMC